MIFSRRAITPSAGERNVNKWLNHYHVPAKSLAKYNKGRFDLESNESGIEDHWGNSDGAPRKELTAQHINAVTLDTYPAFLIRYLFWQLVNDVEYMMDGEGDERTAIGGVYPWGHKANWLR